MTVSPVTGVGTGPKTVAMVTTGEGPPSSPPTMIVFTFVSSSEIHVAWTSPQNKNLNGVLRHFIVQWRESSKEKIRNKTVSGNKSSHELTGLKHFTEYDIRIAAVTVARGPFSNWFTIRTNETSKSIYCTEFYANKLI